MWLTSYRRTAWLAGALAAGLASVALNKTFAEERAAATSSAATTLKASKPVGDASAGAIAEDRRFTPDAAPLAWRYIVMHHSATEQGDVASIDAVHKRRVDAQGKPWLGIGYHFVIGNGQGLADGKIEPTFRWQKQLAGAHAGAGAYNTAGIGVCLIGNFESSPPTPRQLAAAKEVVALLATRYKIPPKQIVRHRDVKATECPGKHFDLQSVLPASPK